MRFVFVRHVMRSMMVWVLAAGASCATTSTSTPAPAKTATPRRSVVVQQGAALPGASGVPNKQAAATASVVNQRLTKIKDCYETELAGNPMLSGQVVIHWLIDSKGNVPGADVESNSTGNPMLAECIRALIARWTFPAPEGGPAEISFPFVFRATQ